MNDAKPQSGLKLRSDNGQWLCTGCNHYFDYEKLVLVDRGKRCQKCANNGDQITISELQDSQGIAEDLKKLATRANGLLDEMRKSMRSNPHFGTLDSTLDVLEQTTSELSRVLTGDANDSRIRAAAPELLEAIRLCCSAHGRTSKQAWDNVEREEWEVSARAAIAAATGDVK